MSKFKFTIREILFATVAIAAIAALISQNQSSDPTGIPQLMRPAILSIEVAEEMNLQFVGPWKPAESGGGGGSNRETTYDYETTFQLENDGNGEKLMAGLRGKIELLLSEAECNIHGRGWTGKSENELKEFNMEYFRGRTKGRIFARCFQRKRPEEPTEWTIWIFSTETCR